MNHTKLEAVFREVQNVYETANPCGAISLEVTTFSEKPSLVDLTSLYKKRGFGESALGGILYRNISLSELRKMFQKFVDDSWVPEIEVFVDDIVKSIMVNQQSVCVLIHEQEDAGFVVLSIMSSCGSSWSLLEFNCLTV